MDYWRVQVIFVCKACGILGGLGACSPGEILILDLLLGGIWDCFRTQTIYCVIILFQGK